MVEEENIELRKSADSNDKELTDLKTSIANTCTQAAASNKNLEKLIAEFEELEWNGMEATKTISLF